MSIGVVLGHFRRPENIQKQLSAVYGQTVMPADVRIWYNNGLKHKDPVPNALNYFEDVSGTFSFNNAGVWARFAYALTLNTEFIAIFDDDTIPGKNWFKHCLNSMEEKEGIYGSNGVLLTEAPSYDYIYKMINLDINTHFTNSIRVDYVGHAWFLKKKWLLPMFKYPIKHSFCGEDMTLSFAAKKDLGINTYVPSHEKDKPENWGSLYQHELGTIKASVYEKGRLEKYAEYLMYLKNAYDWKFIYEENF